MISQENLNPANKLVDEVVNWLCSTLRLRVTAEGVRSLAHLLVVVPTAQSGRSLRLALARRFPGQGLIPPRIATPMQLVVPAAPRYREASSAEIAAVFQKFIGSRRAEILSTDGSSVVRFGHLFTPAAFTDLTARFALLDQLNDIWRILAGGGLLMRDVLNPARAPAAARYLEDNSLGDEIERWQELAELEGLFFEALHARGICHPVENVSAACDEPAPIADEVEMVVLPALADPVRVLPRVLERQRDSLKVVVLLHAGADAVAKFDVWGRPITSEWIGERRPDFAAFGNRDIVRSATDTALAAAVVRDFPAAGSAVERPAISLCDEKLFPVVSAAFLNLGYVLHNPERHRLAQSSLGLLARNVSALYESRPEGLPWREFAAVMRADDVLRALVADENLRVRVLEGLDVAQNNFIPSVLPPNVGFPAVEINPVWKTEAYEAFRTHARKLLDWLQEARAAGSLIGFVRAMLARVFEGRSLTGGAGEKEFRAAADSLRELLGALDCEIVGDLALSSKEAQALFRRELDAAVYSLEPDSPDSVKTEGWLELAWSAADHIALAGFHEGNVPDSVNGHPFLPDALRSALGLTTNDDRLARDTWLFGELVASHREHALRVYIARTNDAGDIRRPSRILYLCADRVLPERTGYLFGDIPEAAAVNRSRRVAPGWELALPDSLAVPTSFSPSRLDAYIKCPFTYLLKYGVGMEAYQDKTELEANDFGTACHLALELYARAMIARGDNQLTDADDIRAFFRGEIFPAIRQRYGAFPHLNLRLQLDAVEGRIGVFADIQSEWAQQGWRIREAEFNVKGSHPLADFGVDAEIRGVIDRIDQNINTGRYRVIDYKTWDDVKSAKRHVFLDVSKDEAQQRFAARMHYPVIPAGVCKNGNSKNDARRFASIQLPLYARCLETLDPRYAGNVEDLCYCVLGESAEKSGEYRDGLLDYADIALATVCQAIRNISANIFWPPGPSDEWKWDFQPLFVADPLRDLAGSSWAERQNEKCAPGEEVENA